jgi:hypothetical protein
MRRILDIPVEKVAPDAKGVFQLQGIPADVEPPERVRAIYRSAETLFYELAEPKGIMADITIDEFREVYPGTGKNDPETPLERIFPRAFALALAACTMGEAVSLKIEELMKTRFGDFALGFMLDSVASYCADRASGVVESVFLQRVSSLPGAGEAVENYMKVLMYSPGYCGWHVSGQGRLFEYLKPEEIGINLTPSSLMVPLKSVSGVLVAGDVGIHRFDNDFSFCDVCRTFNCRQRMDG